MQCIGEEFPQSIMERPFAVEPTGLKDPNQFPDLRESTNWCPFLIIQSSFISVMLLRFGGQGMQWILMSDQQ